MPAKANKLKGGVEVESIMIIGAIILVLSVIVWAGIKWTEVTHGACIAGLQSQVIDVQAEFSKLKNDGDGPIQIPVALPECSDSIVFSNREELSKISLPTSVGGDLKCPEGYEGLIIGFPKPKEGEGWWSALKKAWQGDASDLAKKIGSLKIESLQLRPFCKNLLAKQHKFKEKVELERSSQQDKFCIKAKRQNNGIFELEKIPIADEKQYQKCREGAL